MLRRILSVAVALFVVTGLAFAGEHQGLVTKVSKDEITILVKGKKKGKGEEKTFKVSDKFEIKKGDETIKLDDLTKLIDEATGKVKGVPGKLKTDGEGDAEKAVSFTVVEKKKKKDK